MKFSHSEEDREGKHLDVLIDEENGLRIIVSRLGAELVSLARINEAGEWTGFLYRDNDISAPSQGWANHATVMGYYLHRLKDGRSLYRGREIKGGNHGFLRSKTWHLVETSLQGSGASLQYRITPNDFSAVEYPLKVSVVLTYSIDANKLGVFFEFRNEEPELDAHVSFGLHPGFAATSFEGFHLQMPEDFTAVTFRRETIFPNRRAISSLPVAKCRFRKRNCPDPSSWSFSTFQGVDFPMSIRQAAAGSSSI